MLELIAIGLANLARQDLFTPRRRENLPVIQFPAPLPTVHVGNLDTSLRALQTHAWSAYGQLEREAAAVRMGQRKTIG